MLGAPASSLTGMAHDHPSHITGEQGMSDPIPACMNCRHHKVIPARTMVEERRSWWGRVEKIAEVIPERHVCLVFTDIITGEPVANLCEDMRSPRMAPSLACGPFAKYFEPKESATSADPI